MRFLLSVIDNETRSPHTSEEITAINQFNDYLEGKGYRKLAIGLESPSEAKVFDFRNSRNEITAGPLVELVEFTSGLWLIEVPDRAIAEELAAKASKACNRKIEIRPVIN